jgi:tetratricopeptide (TPR) repeat protein
LTAAACFLAASVLAAVTTNPVDIDALVDQGRVDDALAAGRAAVAVEPEDAELRFALAKALAVKARRAEMQPERIEVGYDAPLFEEAILHLGEAIRLAPKRADLRMFQCLLLTDSARIERAAAAVRSAARELPHEASTATELARFGAERGKRGDLEGAARLLGEVASAYPEIAPVQADYGMTLARLGRGVDALRALDRAVAAAPKELPMLRMRATAAMALLEFAKAESSYDAAFAVSRDESDRFGSAAAAYGGDRARGLSRMEELSAPGASAPAGLADLASRFVRAGRAADPGKAEADLGRDLRAQGQPLLAVPLLHRASSRAELVEVYRELGMPGLAARAGSGR